MEKYNVCFLSVGDDYGNDVPKTFFDERKVFVCTDNLSKFPYASCTLYDKKIFNYFDKLYFAIDTVLKTKEPIILVDDDKFDKVYMFEKSFKQLQNFDKKLFNSFAYESLWENQDLNLKSMIHEMNNLDDRYALNLNWFNELLEYKEIDTTQILPILEQIIYFPYIHNLINIRKYLEEIEDMFYIMSIISGSYTKNSICSGEGLALSYALYRENVNSININKY